MSLVIVCSRVQVLQFRRHRCVSACLRTVIACISSHVDPTMAPSLLAYVCSSILYVIEYQCRYFDCEASESTAQLARYPRSWKNALRDNCTS